jgi:nucleoside-diphosphate-sugar epimerase
MGRAIVSGITGHLGTELSSQLIALDIEVHGLTRQDIPTLPGSTKHRFLHKIDGRTETLIELFERVKPDVVFHLAALARREHLSKDVTPFITANILFGTQLLEAARHANCLRFVTTGSRLQHSENGSYHAFNLYAATKQAFEDLLVYYADAFNFAAIALTLPNIYSEFDPRPTLLTEMAAASVDGVPLLLHGREAWVDLVHVEDAASALIQAMRLCDGSDVRTKKVLSRYSISSDGYMTATELMEIFEQIGKRKLTLQRGTPSKPSRRVRPWRGTSLPGWSPHVKLEDGIARLLACRRK